MEASELRIGNYIYQCDVGLHCGKTIENVSLSILKDLTYYEPIPLTEEWLLKFGFESIDDFWDDIQSKIYSKIEFDSSDTEMLEYVHQLQNLYFTLTVEELTIKETL